MVKKKASRTNKSFGRKKLRSKGKAPKKRSAARKKPIRQRRKSRVRSKQEIASRIVITGLRGLGAATGGQSGDIQGLSRIQEGDSESVEELVEEGQYFEAEAVSGVENAKDPDQGEVTTHEVPEDDVPTEYTDRDKI